MLTYLLTYLLTCLLAYLLTFYANKQTHRSVSVHSLIRKDLHSVMGQSAHTDLLVKGDRYSRYVSVHASHPSEVSFVPGRAFQLVSGALNKVGA